MPELENSNSEALIRSMIQDIKTEKIQNHIGLTTLAQIIHKNHLPLILKEFSDAFPVEETKIDNIWSHRLVCSFFPCFIRRLEISEYGNLIATMANNESVASILPYWTPGKLVEELPPESAKQFLYILFDNDKAFNYFFTNPFSLIKSVIWKDVICNRLIRRPNGCDLLDYSSLEYSMLGEFMPVKVAAEFLRQYIASREVICDHLLDFVLPVLLRASPEEKDSFVHEVFGQREIREKLYTTSLATLCSVTALLSKDVTDILLTDGFFLRPEHVMLMSGDNLLKVTPAVRRGFVESLVSQRENHKFILLDRDLKYQNPTVSTFFMDIKSRKYLAETIDSDQIMKLLTSINKCLYLEFGPEIIIDFIMKYIERLDRETLLKFYQQLYSSPDLCELMTNYELIRVILKEDKQFRVRFVEMCKFYEYLYRRTNTSIVFRAISSGYVEDVQCWLETSSGTASFRNGRIDEYDILSREAISIYIKEKIDGNAKSYMQDIINLFFKHGLCPNDIHQFYDILSRIYNDPLSVINFFSAGAYCDSQPVPQGPVELNQREKAINTLYAHIPEVKQHMLEAGATPDELKNYHEALKRAGEFNTRILIATHHPEFVCRNAFLNFCLVLPFTRDSLFQKLPFDVLMIIIRLAGMAPDKPGVDCRGLLAARYQQHEKLKRMSQLPGGINVCEQISHSGKKEFLFFKSTLTLTNDYLQTKMPKEEFRRQYAERCRLNHFGAIGLVQRMQVENLLKYSPLYQDLAKDAALIKEKEQFNKHSTEIINEFVLM